MMTFHEEYPSGALVGVYYGNGLQASRREVCYRRNDPFLYDDAQQLLHEFDARVVAPAEAKAKEQRSR
jgi:hypothetical protein